MTKKKSSRSHEQIVGDIEHAGDAAASIVARRKRAWDEDELLRLAGEAVIGRVAEAAGRLPEEITQQVSDVPWEDIRDIRILVDHIYHRIDYEGLWNTLENDIPFLLQRIAEWRSSSV